MSSVRATENERRRSKPKKKNDREDRRVVEWNEINDWNVLEWNWNEMTFSHAIWSDQKKNTTQLLEKERADWKDN